MRFSASKALPAAAILGALLLAGCGGSDSESGDPPTPTPESITERIEQAPFDGIPFDGTFVGDPEAPLLIEMYEDFGCPHCLEFTSDMEPHLLENYVEPGDVRLQYRFFPLRQVTANAAIAAWCAAEQDEFWPYHEELFIAQANANDGSGPDLNSAFDIPALGTLAEELGLDRAEFDACTTSEEVIDVITSDLRTATELNLPGTPSFVINGEVLEDVPETRDEWTELLDGLLEE